jgi:glycosyltransferase involved in cell wall biosynthesis
LVHALVLALFSEVVISMILPNKIYHCSAITASAGGGVKTYVDGLYMAMPDTFGSEIIANLGDYDQSDFKLLHIHETSAIAQVSNACPAVFTAHNHDVYCASGTKYLSGSKSTCDRILNNWGCAWGHMVDGCGSRRPAQILRNLERASTELDALKELGILTIANSDYVRSQLIANGLPASQVITLRCGIAPTTSHHAPLERDIHSQKRILFAGRIVPDKGLDWLLRVMPFLDPHIHLDIAGEGWASPQVRQLAEDLNIGSDRITWHGWCQKEKLEDLYRQSFAVIFPSVWPEPAGLVTLEAYVRFRPVIASAVGGIPEHIQDGKTGILVEPNNAEQLATAIMDLANNFDKAREIGIAGNALFYSEFTLEIHAQKLQEVYELAIAKFAEKK